VIGSIGTGRHELATGLGHAARMTEVLVRRCRKSHR
jgi:hypothetical protein